MPFGACAVLVRNTVSPADCGTTFSYVGLEHIGEGTLTLTGVGESQVT